MRIRWTKSAADINEHDSAVTARRVALSIYVRVSPLAELPERGRLLANARFVCHHCRAAVILPLESFNGRHHDPIPHTPRGAARHHRTRHTGHQPANSCGAGDPLFMGPQLEPWPFERARKAHLAVAPHRQRT